MLTKKLRKRKIRCMLIISILFNFFIYVNLVLLTTNGSLIYLYWCDAGRWYTVHREHEPSTGQRPAAGTVHVQNNTPSRDDTKVGQACSGMKGMTCPALLWLPCPDAFSLLQTNQCSQGFKQNFELPCTKRFLLLLFLHFCKHSLGLPQRDLFITLWIYTICSCWFAIVCIFNGMVPTLCVAWCAQTHGDFMYGL